MSSLKRQPIIHFDAIIDVGLPAVIIWCKSMNGFMSIIFIKWYIRIWRLFCCKATKQKQLSSGKRFHLCIATV